MTTTKDLIEGACIYDHSGPRVEGYWVIHGWRLREVLRSHNDTIGTLWKNMVALQDRVDQLEKRNTSTVPSVPVPTSTPESGKRVRTRRTSARGATANGDPSTTQP